MTRFALRYPFLVIVVCLITTVVGVTSLLRMPVDLFPPINIPVVVVATFFSGMPPEEIENDIRHALSYVADLADDSGNIAPAPSRGARRRRGAVATAALELDQV